MAGASPPPPPPPAASNPIPPPVPGWTSPPPRRPILDRAGLASALVPWGRILGFLLLFAGTLIAVAAGTIQPVCYASSQCSTWPPNWAWAVGIGQLLWVIGLFFLGGASGLQLLHGLPKPNGGTPEEYRWVITERWFNFLMLSLSIVLLWFLLGGILTLRPGFVP